MSNQDQPQPNGSQPAGADSSPGQAAPGAGPSEPPQYPQGQQYPQAQPGSQYPQGQPGQQYPQYPPQGPGYPQQQYPQGYPGGQPPQGPPVYPPQYPQGSPQQPGGMYPYGAYPGMPPVQSAQEIKFGYGKIESELLYPAAPITLIKAVAEEQAGLRVGKKPLRKFNWWFGDVMLMGFAWIVFGIIAIAIVGSHADQTSWAVIVLQVVPWFGLAGWPLLLTTLAGNGPRIDLGLRWSWRDVGWGFLYGILALIVASVLGYITTQIAGDFDSAAGEVGQGLSSNLPLAIVFALCVCVGAPIVEEIAFRGLVFTSLAKFNMWPVLTVIFSAAVFSGFHFEPVRFFLLFGVGVVLGCARWHTGSITTSIVAHATNNLPGALFLLFGHS